MGLADALNEQSVFPRDIIELIRMGEKTNRLEKVLQTTALRLEARNEQSLESGAATARTNVNGRNGVIDWIRDDRFANANIQCLRHNVSIGTDMNDETRKYR